MTKRHNEAEIPSNGTTPERKYPPVSPIRSSNARKTENDRYNKNKTNDNPSPSGETEYGPQNKDKTTSHQPSPTGNSSSESDEDSNSKGDTTFDIEQSPLRFPPSPRQDKTQDDQPPAWLIHLRRDLENQIESSMKEIRQHYETPAKPTKPDSTVDSPDTAKSTPTSDETTMTNNASVNKPPSSAPTQQPITQPPILTSQIGGAAMAQATQIQHILSALTSAVDKPEKIKLDELKVKEYSAWADETIIKTSRSSLLVKLIDPSTNTIVLPHQITNAMQKPNREFFHLVYDALPKWLRQHLVDPNQGLDGVSLWSQLKTYCHRDTTSFMDRKALETSFMTITRGKSENIFQFRSRYERTYKDLTAKGMQSWQFHDLATHFIGALHEEHLEHIYQEYETNGYYGSWGVSTLRDLSERLDSVLRKKKNRVKQQTPTNQEPEKTDKSRNNRDKQKDRNDRSNQGQRQGQNREADTRSSQDRNNRRGRQSDRNPSDDDNRDPLEPVLPIQKEIVRCFKTSEMTPAKFEHFKNLHPYGCAWHGGSYTHTLDECYSMKKLKEKYSQDRGQTQAGRRTTVEDNGGDDDNSNGDNASNDSFSHYSVDFYKPTSNSRVRFRQEIASCRYTTPDTPIHLTTASQRMIVDSGATRHMSGLEHIFSHIDLWDETDPITKVVTLGDGTTTLPIKGSGTVQIVMNGHHVSLHDVLYVPALKDTLFSIKEHSTHRGCAFISENATATLFFPKFEVPVSTADEFELAFTIPSSNSSPEFNTEFSPRIFPEQPVQVISTALAKMAPLTEKDITRCSKQVMIKLLAADAVIPSRATVGSIGFDISTNTATTIPAHSQRIIPTGIAMAIPSGMYGRIAPKSGLAAKHEVSIEGGVIDNDYRGEVKVIFRNMGGQDLTITKGQQIAQIIFEQAHIPMIAVSSNLPHTKRDTKGFGSTSSRLQIHRTKHNVIIVKKRKNGEKARIFHAPTLIDDEDGTPEQLHTPASIIPYNEDENAEEDEFLDNPLPPIQDRQIDQSAGTPPVRAVDKANTSLPSVITMSRDDLRHALGWRNIDKVMKHLTAIAKPTIHIADPTPEPMESIGPVSTVDKRRANTTPVLPPQQYADVFHMDIVYGTGKAIGGIRYGLFIVDRATRKKHIYPLKNLNSSILRAVKKFVSHIGRTPKKIYADFDEKIIKGDVAEYLESIGTTILGAPSHRQEQNGLVERNWRSVVRMARAYLTRHLLPTKYWFFALRRAVEAANYMPIERSGSVTTPHELTHGEKPDYRTLIPIFSVAYVRRKKDGKIKRGQFHAQAIKCIIVGQCQHSDSLLFYHPGSAQIFTSNDYSLDNKLPSGPQFNLRYDGGLDYDRYTPETARHRPLSHELTETVVIKHPMTSQMIEAKILDVPLHEDTEPYTVQTCESKEIIQVFTPDIHNQKPSTEEAENMGGDEYISKVPWIKPDARAILFTSSMTKPLQGTLHLQPDDEWEFIPGRKGSKTVKKAIRLENFRDVAEEMIHNKKLFEGWAHRFSKITQERRQVAMANVVAHNIHAKHISAQNLSSLDAPTLTQHIKMKPGDKEIWDAAYAEEYNGLTNLPAWETISEAEYKKIKHLTGDLLPTMAISTVKVDENGKPKRAKYRIVALGNLDPHEWSKNECYAPVMSLFELRLMCALAARHKRIPKNGDVKQAFCQAVLPDGEKYALRPPAGCPLTPPKSYWILKRTLYGLKRSPRHWYDKAKNLLEKIGLKQCKNSPCLFKGTIIKGEPPIYLGLYVDDFIYFGGNDKVEREFEKQLGALTTVDFMGPATHFLGIKVQSQVNDDGHVDIHLSQQAFAESLIAQMELDGPEIGDKPTPYRSGHPVDAIPHKNMTTEQRAPLIRQMRTLVGSLLWLSQATRPDLSTITNMLAKYSSNPSPGHISAAKYVIKYIKGTKSRGIKFSSRVDDKLTSYLKFPTDPEKITALTDANWGPQDQSVPKTPQQIELFKSRSISGYLLFLGGPLHWESKRQKITARSSAESEIYATDECVKRLLQIKNISEDLGLKDLIFHATTPVYNDNTACVMWSGSLTTRGLRHLQMRENAVRESHQNGFIKCIHIKGAINLSDMFTKEDKHVAHFIEIRDHTTSLPLAMRQIQND